MTTENKYEVNENWYKGSDTNKTEIQAYNRYIDENNNPVNWVGSILKWVLPFLKLGRIFI